MHPHKMKRRRIMSNELVFSFWDAASAAEIVDKTDDTESRCVASRRGILSGGSTVPNTWFSSVFGNEAQSSCF